MADDDSFELTKIDETTREKLRQTVAKIERLEENIALFDFSLSNEEMAQIGALAQRQNRIVDWSWSPKWD